MSILPHSSATLAQPSSKEIAHLLVAHGSRDPQFAQAVDALAETLRAQCSSSVIGKAVGTAYLELAPTSLEAQIVVFARQTGCAQLRVLPLFLAPGVHSSIDLPAAVAIAQAELGASCKLRLLDPLGNAMAKILRPLRQTLPQDTILLAHGSRHAGNFLVDLAAELQTIPAYWAILPSTDPEATLANQVTSISTAAEIGILLYFLFPGKTSRLIDAAISELKLRFPQSHMRSTSLLGEDPRVIQEIGQLLFGTGDLS
jgi:sirohydrochlorin cobaltochelatase